MNSNKSKKENEVEEFGSIYELREQKSEKQKLRDMTFKEKVTYFNNYYRNKTLLGIILIAIVISYIYTVVTPDAETVLYTIVINNAIDDNTAATLKDDFSKQLSLDSKKQLVNIDTSFLISEDSVSEYSFASQQKLNAYVFAKQVDVIITKESDFKQYAYYGYCAKLTDVLPTDLCNSLADSFFYSDAEDDKAISAYGIYLDNSSYIKTNGEQADTSSDRVVLGIITNTKYPENTVEFVRYLFNLY